ncbi:hypothetical protein [Streptomyces sp. ISL-100]|uniref:hypothetical protein n=1 Tax=Streptomyces sp. ISL-100 TaxID=2819173 RepID=UPI001BEC22A2|nr:hypothetical protein [Streptomyces sp. ISL-100]MBT2395348.1 hypothetical protein [Streptomyces sp. ISL-100]
MVGTSTEPCRDLDPPLGTHGVLVHTRQAQELAVGHWLLTATNDRRTARVERETSGIALLRCGSIFSAIRIPAAVVRAAAGTDDTEAVDAYLCEALQDGPVFADAYSRRYYALVPASTALRWDVPNTECLGVNCFVGVPSPKLTDPAYPSYWSVPMNGPGALCTPGAVSQLVLYGRFRQAEARR